LVDIKFPNPTNAVGGSFTLCLHERPAGPLFEITFPNPTNAVGGSFRLCLYEQPADSSSQLHSHPTKPTGGSFIVHLHERPGDASSKLHSQIPPTQLVDRSGSAYTSSRPTPPRNYIPNPTNAVGGSFTLNLHEQPADSRFSKLQSPQSHQRSWWI